MGIRELGKGALGIISLRTGEGRRALLAATYLFLIIASYMALKPVRNSLFLDEFGAMDLPYVMFAYALGAGFFVAAYTRLAKRIAGHVLVVGTLVFVISNLLVFWWLAQQQVRWLYPILYIWVGMYGAIAPAQVWTLVGNLFTVREAKRTFGLIGGGGILGAIVGSSVAGVVSKVVGTIHVLLFTCLLLVLAIVVVYLLSRAPTVRTRQQGEDAIPTRITETLRLIARSSHMRAIAGLVFLTATATSIIDWQFKAVAAERLSGDDLTAFFSLFFAVTSTLSILVQILLTSRLIRWIGLGGALLILPLSLMAGVIGLLIQAKLWAAALVKGAEQSLKHSLDRASRELLYLPLSPRLKLPVKSAIDMVIDRCGDGTAGVLVLATILLIPAAAGPMSTVTVVGLINLALLVAWILLALRLRSSYQGELARSIAAGRVEVSNWSEALAGGEFLEAIRHSLTSPREEVVLEALDLVARNPQWKVEEPLLKLLSSASAEVRARVMSTLLVPGEERLPEGLAEQFGLEDQEILAECLDILLASEESERGQRVEKLLARAGGTARGTWIVLLVRRLGPEYIPFAQKLISSLLDPESPAAGRRVAAAAIGNMPLATGMHQWLPDLLLDDDLQVAAAAATSAGSVGGKDLLREVVPLLAHTAARPAARRALQRRGSEAVPLLLHAARDPTCTMTVRRRVPPVLAGIGNSEAVSGLIALLYSVDLPIVEAASLALTQLGGVDRGISPMNLVRERLLTLARKYQLFRQSAVELKRGLAECASEKARLLETSLDSAAHTCGRLVFRLLCLMHSPRRMVPPWRGLHGEDPVARANAIELLEGLGPRRLGRSLMPCLAPLDGVLKKRNSSAPKPWNQQLLALAGGNQSWLAQVAGELAAELELTEPVEKTVALMSVVDKVIVLRKVDLFGEIPSEELARIAALALKVSYAEGEYLCRQDDPAGDLFVLLGGEVLVDRDGIELGRLGKGEAVGAWGLFEEESRQASARAQEQVQALRIDRWGFDELLNEHPEIARSFIRHLVRRMRQLAGR